MGTEWFKKFREFLEKFLVLKSQKIENFSKKSAAIATFEEKNEKKSRFPYHFGLNSSFQ